MLTLKCSIWSWKRIVINHFVADERWRYYDGYYSPCYVLRILGMSLSLIYKVRLILTKKLVRLEEGLKNEHAEAYRYYGAP